MKFVRIEIAPDLDVVSDPPFPAETYYIQKDEISSEHLTSFQAFVKKRNVQPKTDEVQMMSSMYSPCEWRDFSNLAAIMSEYDPDSPDTLKMPAPIPNDKKGKLGKRTAFTMGQRYMASSQLLVAKTTADLE